ncbi:hypothetical protein [Mariniblastus fucicola]|uniref:Uncharacterized protein n=1 Tax=Mariniblastus fucicola TaxID=980251 RepID=A0A5B9P7P3_9BACT|nr:hypothetical protein [Mariniblastus fucicola]QEG22354.1 hypothetical protein MFFC18_22340 [Mariniblastus fucicola]
MQQLFEQFAADVAAQPQWLQIWGNILGPVTLLSMILFLFRRNLIPVALLTVFVLPSMLLLYHNFGYSRILGLAHIVFWTPADVYLLKIRTTWRVRETWLGKWIIVALAVMLISLAFDYVDLARWLLGDRGRVHLSMMRTELAGLSQRHERGQITIAEDGTASRMALAAPKHGS